MHLEKLTLKNWECHKFEEFSFGTGVIGVVGQNGSGKSSVLRALAYVFFCDDRTMGSREEYLRVGATTGSVELVFSHGDSRYRVFRALAPKKQTLSQISKLDKPIGTTYTRVDEITRELQALLGVTTKTLQKNVFVAQGDLDSILYATDGQRMAEFQQTFGLMRAQEAYKAVSDEISSFVVTPGLDARLQAAVDSCQESLEAITRLRGTQDTLDQDVALKERSALALKQTREVSRLTSAAAEADRQVAELVQRVDRLTQELAVADLVVQNSEVRFSAVQSHVEQAESQLEVLRGQQARFDRQQVVRARAIQLDQQLAEPAPASEEVTELEARVAKSEAQLRNLQAMLSGAIPRKQLPREPELQAELRDVRARLRELPPTPAATAEVLELRHTVKTLTEHLEIFASGTCPTCGQELHDFDPQAQQQALQVAQTQLSDLMARLTDELRASRDSLTRQMQDLTAEQAAIDELAMKTMRTVADRTESTLVEQRQAAATARAQLSDRQLLEAEKRVLEADLVEVVSEPDQDEIVALEDVLASATAIHGELSVADSRRDVATTLLESATNELAQVRRMREQLGVLADPLPPEEIQRLEADEQRLLELQVERRALLDELTANEVRLEQYQLLVTQLTDQAREEAFSSRWVHSCSRIRELLHNTKGLPALMLREYAARLNARIAYYLNLWEAPFSLSLDDNLAFVAEFPDGRRLSAIRLSGGQKIVASVSFRLAMTDTFAGDVRLLILDEPTVYLDKENIVHFQTLLLRLKTLAGTTGRQIVLVTHESGLSGFFDHLIQIGVAGMTADVA